MRFDLFVGLWLGLLTPSLRPALRVAGAEGPRDTCSVRVSDRARPSIVKGHIGVLAALALVLACTPDARRTHAGRTRGSSPRVPRALACAMDAGFRALTLHSATHTVKPRPGSVATLIDDDRGT
jgi:hypothetical protein